MARKKLTLTEVRRALRKVRTKLLNGKITKEQFDMDDIIDVKVSGPRGPVCGTVACIGGHMAVELFPRILHDYACLSRAGSMVMGEALQLQPNLDKLFYHYPPHSNITRRQAAFAITRALDGAEDPWKTRARK